MKKTIFSLITATLFLTYGAIAQENKTAFTLDEAVQYALDNNVNIQNSRIDEQIAKKKVRETTAIAYPKINGAVNFNYYPQLPVSLIPAEFFSDSTNPAAPGEFVAIKFGTEYNLTASATLSQLIFDGTYIVGLRAAKTYRELAAQQTQLTAKELKEEVQKAYYASLLVTENLTIIDSNLAEINKQLFEIEQQYKAGFIEEIDVDRTRLSKAELENELYGLQRQQAVAILTLKLQMGYPIEKELVLMGNIASYVQQAEQVSTPDATAVVQNRIEYKLIQTQQELENLNTQRYKALYLPQLNGQLTHQQNAQRNEFSFFESGEPWFPTTIIGLSLNLPIWDSFTKKYQIQQSKLQLEKLENTETNLKQSMYVEIENAQNQYTTAQKRMKTAEENLELARRIYDKSEIKYREGVGSSLEYSTSRTGFYRAQSNYFSAIYEFLLAKVNLNRALENL